MSYPGPSECRRQDHVNAAYINAALKIKAMLGARRAENFLLVCGIPEKLVTRVLLAEAETRRLSK